MLLHLPLHRPKERYSKLPVPILRESKKLSALFQSTIGHVSMFYTGVKIEKKKTRDPRFQTQSGELNEEKFHQNYSFVTDVNRENLSVSQHAPNNSLSYSLCFQWMPELWKTDS